MWPWRFASLLAVPALLGPSPAAHAGCVSSDAANPIAADYPDAPTGVINGTLMLIPIPLAAAQAAVPPQARILEAAFRDLLPSFPAGMYPLVFQAVHDHDIRDAALGITVPDFSRAGLEFPFLDLLGDGYSSFRYVNAQLLSADNPIALAGSLAYGTVVYASTFDPQCDAYAFASFADGPGSVDTFFSARSIVPLPVIANITGLASGAAAARLDVRPAVYGLPYPEAQFIDFWTNVTNQPIFSGPAPVVCDNMIRLFNTSVTLRADGAPRLVRGSVAQTGLVPSLPVAWDEVDGVQVATAFIEHNYVPCSSLKGYH